MKNIAGVKDATLDLNRVDQQLKKMGREFIYVKTEQPWNLIQEVGCISVTANVAAKLCSEFPDASLKRNKKSHKKNKRN